MATSCHLAKSCIHQPVGQVVVGACWQLTWEADCEKRAGQKSPCNKLKQDSLVACTTYSPSSSETSKSKVKSRVQTTNGGHSAL